MKDKNFIDQHTTQINNGFEPKTTMYVIENAIYTNKKIVDEHISKNQVKPLSDIDLWQIRPPPLYKR